VGWGMGLNRGVTETIVDRIAERVAAFGAGEKVILVGWSLGGIYARVVAQERPDLVEKVVTLGSPFSGDRRRNNNVWRLYEMVAGHPVHAPPIEKDPAVKPPVPTLAIWSRRDGIVSVDGARGKPGERDAELELDCSHMGFGVSGRAYPRIVEAVKGF
ncbi:MAG: alpha/beta fold hydrolase, partial [Allosphingosinicella sp.]